MKQLFQSFEHKLLATLSFALAIVMVFFVAREVQSMNFLILSTNTDVFYALLAVLGISIPGTVAFFATNIADWRTLLTKILLALFPAMFMLIFALWESNGFHYMFQLTAGAYILAICFLLLVEHHDKYASEMSAVQEPALSRKEWFASQSKTTLALIAIIVAINLGFGAYKVASYAAVDEALWTFGKRISKYWTNMADHDWNGTKVSDKPGVTVAIISGTGLLFEDPKDYKPIKLYGSPTEHPKNDIRKMNFALRFPIVLFAALSLFAIYFFLERLLDEKKALFATALIGTSPILIGMERIINPDSILWIFSTLSIASYLGFLRRKHLVYLYWAGIFTGLALLTKYVANILFVFYFGVIFLEYIFMKASDRKDTSIIRYIRQSFLHYFILTVIAVAVFYILYPHTWVKPSRLLDATLLSQAFESTWPIFVGIIAFIFLDQKFFGNQIVKAILDFVATHRVWFIRAFGIAFFAAASFAIINTLLGMRWIDFEQVLASPKTSFRSIGFLGILLGNFYPMIFGIHALALLAILGTCLTLIFRASDMTRSKVIVLYGIIFTLLYYFGSTVNHVATISRYQIMIFPIALLIAGIGLAHIAQAFSDKFPKVPFATYPIIALGIATFALAGSHPNHLGYASALLPKNYIIDIKDMGDGSFEAAAYLNSLPNAEHINIWTDKNGVCLFFVGNCYDGFTFSRLHKVPFDYIVVSSGRANRTDNMTPALGTKANVVPFDTYYAKQGEWELHIDNRPKNFVKVVPFEPLPEE